MLGRFWSESFWLPSNTTWENISNGSGKAVVYAEAKDYWVQIPLVLFSLILRFFTERYIFVPMGKFLKISGIKKKMAPPNAKLEAEYRKSSKCKNATALSKQLDLSEREIERWWRRRRGQDKPTTLVKFCENMWKGTFFLINVPLGLYVVWGQEWAMDMEKCFDGYPHQGITPEIWWFYMLSSGFYISLMITQFWDVRRKDFWQMFVHHIVAVVLFYCSWASQCFRAGCVVMLLHDSTDVVLELGKAAKYAQFHRTVNCLFVVFVIVWVGTRLVLFPIFFIFTGFKLGNVISPVASLMYILLVVLLILTFFWTWLIFKAVKRTILAGEYATDIRSSASEDSDASSSQGALDVSRKVSQ